jgi:hypothetical protein
MLAPYPRIKPFLDDTVERATLTAEHDGTIVIAAIKELSQKGSTFDRSWGIICQLG